MAGFRPLYKDSIYPTSQRHSRKGVVFYQGRLMVKGGINRRPQFAWQCEHRHDDRDDAEDCATAALNCDPGSLMAEELQKRVNEVCQDGSDYRR